MPATIRPTTLPPEIQALFAQWGVPPSEYTHELFSYANIVAQNPKSRIGDIVVSFGYATRDDVERHAANKPANVLLLDYLADRIDNIRANSQKLLAANDKFAYYDQLPAENVHSELNGNDALSRFCVTHDCLVLTGQEEHQIRVVFADYARLKDYRERSRLARMNDPIGILCTKTGAMAILGIANRTALTQLLYAGKSDGGAVTEQEDQLTIWSANDAETDNQRLLVRIFNEAISKKATNIKFTPLHNGTMEVLYRRHGDMRDFKDIRPLDPEQANEILNFLHARSSARYTSNHKRVEGRLLSPADGYMVFRTGSSETFMRYGFVPVGSDSISQARESVSVRLLDRKAVTIRLGDLNLTDTVIEGIDDRLRQKHGLILVVGPVSSGKSTTVAGVVTAYRDIYGRTRNVMSLEQPIERPIEGITQVQVSQANYEPYMGAMLRHDPNFIWIGEMRDRPSASTGVRAANTGQIVVSTLHADDSTLALGALLAYISNTTGSGADSVIVTAYDAINALSLIIAQRLVPELCPHCRIPFAKHPGAAQYKRAYDTYCERNEARQRDIRATFLRNPQGCNRCDDEGFVGERPINELLPISRQLRRGLTAALHTHQSMDEILASARTHTLHDDAMRLVEKGLVSIADALI